MPVCYLARPRAISPLLFPPKESDFNNRFDIPTVAISELEDTPRDGM